jgi:hypothetical protein
VVVRLIAAGAHVNYAHPPDGTTALHIAANVDVVDRLIAVRADVNYAIPQNGAMASNFAAEPGSVLVVARRIAARTDIDKARTTGGSPLYIAVQGGHVLVVQLLITAQA